MRPFPMWVPLFCLLLRPGVHAEEWRVGAALPLTGQMGEHSKAVLAGLQAAVNQANAEGSVPGGNRLTLLVKDTGGRAAQAALLSQALATEDLVVALVHPVGAEAARAQATVARVVRLPMVGASSVESLRRPPLRMVFPTRAALADELMIVLNASGGANLTREWLVCAPGSGDDFRELERATARAARAGYSKVTLVGTDDLAMHLRSISAHPNAALFIALPVEAATTILGKVPRSATRIVSSRCVPEQLARAAEGAAEGVVVMVPLPFYGDDRLPLARAYRSAMGNNPQDYASYEAFFTVRVLLEGLRRGGGDRAPEVIADCLETVSGDLDGVPVRYDTGIRQGVEKLWYVRIENGKPVAITAP